MNERVEALRALHDTGRYHACLTEAKEMLAAPSGFTERELAEVARYAASSAMCFGDVFHAQMLAHSEQHHARESGDVEAIARAEYHLATIETQIGDSHWALQAMDNFLALDTPPRPALARYRAAVYFNRGTIFMQRRQHVAAVGEFETARQQYETLGIPHRVAQCDLEAAWAYLRAGQIDEATDYLDQAQRLLKDHPDESLQATAINHRAFWHLRREEYVAAIGLVLELLVPGRPGITDYHMSEAAWIAGECGLVTGQLHEAEQFACVAADRAVKARWPWLMNQANDLRRRVEDAKRDSA